MKDNFWVEFFSIFGVFGRSWTSLGACFVSLGRFWGCEWMESGSYLSLRNWGMEESAEATFISGLQNGFNLV